MSYQGKISIFTQPRVNLMTAPWECKESRDGVHSCLTVYPPLAFLLTPSCNPPRHSPRPSTDLEWIRRDRASVENYNMNTSLDIISRFNHWINGRTPCRKMSARRDSKDKIKERKQHHVLGVHITYRWAIRKASTLRLSPTALEQR